MKLKLIAMLVLGSIQLSAQTFTEKITRELVFEKKDPRNALMIFNLNGDVKVESYTGDKIQVEIEKTVKGKTEARLQLGKEDLQLGMIDLADTIILYVKNSCNQFGRADKSKTGRWQNNRQSNGWAYNWNNNKRGDDNECSKENRYDYKMTFVVKVPANVNVFASTINDGDVDVSGVNGIVTAENINGNVRLIGISGTTRATTINGSVDITYSGNPSGDSRYYSLNGNINANFKKGLAAQLTFKSFNGHFYSSVDDITPMAVKVEKYEKGDGIHYKVNGNRFKVRTGGPLLDFETFNGNVFLREL